MTEHSYEHTDHPSGAMVSVWAKIFWRVAIYGGIIALVVALLLPNVRSARGAAERNQCHNYVQQTLLALQNYHDTRGELPPAYTVDEHGNRLHSWRALILPFTEGTDGVYKLIDFSKPWDAPENEAARNSPSPFHVCPSARLDDEQLTTYLAVVGPKFVFNGPSPRKFSDVKDGLSNTIAIVEVSPDKAVHWMSPHDADETFLFENPEESLKTNHPGLFIAGYLDGHATGIPLDIDPKDLRAMLTIAGGEKLGE
ncbi:DUF1559 family PulG-like putative transporter [Aeoliella sp. SH292]|uniref:DUF1559 family PulG-like putative transporter n=1 Tax=Aeoliella sp. SH292 TaxID=3454464 RepID=UPI003F9C114E